MSVPIFSQALPEPRQTSVGRSILIGCAGCGCCAGVLVVLMFIAAILLFPVKPVLGVAGTDFTLYGKTLNGEDFDWESLLGKYVLVKFTATWCGPCKREIPGMLEAYEQYHDKGLEIVSIYIWEQSADPVTAVKQTVEQEKLPWIILSESLTEKSGQQPQGKAFGIEGVPTMFLVDKEGNILATDTRGARLKQELQKAFGE